MKELAKWAAISREQHSIEMQWDDEAVNVVKDGYNLRFGARSIQHEVEKRIIGQMARIHEHGLIERGSTVHIKGDSNTGSISIEFDNSKVGALREWRSERESDAATLSQRGNDQEADSKQKWFW